MALGAAVALSAGLVPTAHAGRTLRFTETADSLAAGHADGVAIGGSGAITVTPRLSRVGSGAGAGDAAQAWSVAADSRGNLYVGTGPDGRIFRISVAGKQDVFFTVDAPMVTALAFDGSDRLLAAASPGGKIYRIDSAGRGELWSETGQRYVWALAVGPEGRVFAATGEDGAVFRIDREGRADRWFDARDDHVMCLAPAPGGGFLAGSSGRGRVYRIDEDGNGLVLYQDEMPEVVSVAALDDGKVLAAFVSAPARENRRPAVRIELPSGASVTSTGTEQMQAIEEDEGATVRGVIEGLPGAEERRVSGQQGRVVRIDPDGRGDVVWQSRTEAPFAVVADGKGGALFGTGEPARLHRIDGDDDLARLVTLDEGQITGLLRLGRSVFLATSNPAAVYRLESHTAEGGTYLSRSFDAGGPTRWGTIRWTLEGEGGRVEVYTRTGNSERPDATWSAWSPALADPSGSAIVNPDGRFLQWRARFLGPNSLGLRLKDVTLTYAPYNRPPDPREFYVEGDSAAVSGTAVLRWGASDPDQDPLSVEVDYRREGGDWTAIRRPPKGETDEDSPARWDDQRIKLDTESFDEGRYEFRLVVSDQAGNPPGEGLSVTAPVRVRLIVDRTPPQIVVRPDGANLEVVVTDAESDLARLEVTQGGVVRFTPRPLDGVCDSRREVFRFAAPEAAAGGWTLRALDAAGNVAESAVP